MEDLPNTLQQALVGLQAEARRRAEVVEPWHGFWYRRPHVNFPPPGIRHVAEYDGAERLSLVCTQTNLPPRQQKALEREWCERLPTLTHVKLLWFESRVTQELFDAACRMPALEGLWVKWSGMTSSAQVARLSRLKSLHLGSSPSFGPLDVLGDVPLTWLELENNRASCDLSFLKRLPQLQGLAVTGDGNSIKTITLKSLAPLRALSHLQWLRLTTVKVEDGSLAPLADLPSLKYLQLSNRFSVKEIAGLAGRMPQVRSDWFEPVGRPVTWRACKTCGEKTMVMLSGKGTTMLCTACDAARVDKHIAEFERIAQAARSGAGV
jgi:hypothetical protein